MSALICERVSEAWPLHQSLWKITIVDLGRWILDNCTWGWWMPCALDIMDLGLMDACTLITSYLGAGICLSARWTSVTWGLMDARLRVGHQ